MLTVKTCLKIYMFMFSTRFFEVLRGVVVVVWWVFVGLLFGVCLCVLLCCVGCSVVLAVLLLFVCCCVPFVVLMVFCRSSCVVACMRVSADVSQNL